MSQRKWHICTMSRLRISSHSGKHLLVTIVFMSVRLLIFVNGKCSQATKVEGYQGYQQQVIIQNK